jgi:hypothetical protein
MTARAPMIRAGAIAGLMLIAFAATTAPADDRRMPGADVFTTRPDYASLAPASIALLPAVSFDQEPESERLTGVNWAQAFGRRDYRWLSATVSRTLLMNDSTGIALLKLARDGILKSGHVDSLQAPKLCARLRVQALMCVRVEQWEQHAIGHDESGKPWTRVQLRAEMVDSLGRVLWTASGGETTEGAYVEERREASGSAETAPKAEFSTGEGAAPPWSEPLTHIITRWAAAFPKRPTPAPGTQ